MRNLHGPAALSGGGFRWLELALNGLNRPERSLSDDISFSPSRILLSLSLTSPTPFTYLLARFQSSSPRRPKFGALPAFDSLCLVCQIIRTSSDDV
jgi:hypothetical protein